MPDPLCRQADCRNPATHILLTERVLWYREAVLASAAPEIHPTVTTSAQPVPYYCQRHAEEKADAPRT